MLKITIFIISLLAILVQLKRIEKLKENFVSNIINNDMIEKFENNIPNVREMKDSKGKKNNNIDEGNVVNDEEYSKPIKEENNNAGNNNAGNNMPNVTDSNNQSGEKCSPKGQDCLFGCPKVDSKDIPQSSEPKKMNLEEMMATIEDTEKICDMIEEKDKERKEKEEAENLKKQVELNKRFLIQQKAQNKQIEDLQKIVKSMEFTKEMNETAVEKCGLGADQCLEDKEKKLAELLRKKRENKKSVKLNVNIDDFSGKFMEELRNRLKLTPTELAALMEGIKNGSIDLAKLRKQLSGNKMSSGTDNNGTQYKPGQGGDYVYDPKAGCDNCEIDLSEYIDRCKIPCNKCRHPSWNCPQDKKQ